MTRVSLSPNPPEPFRGNTQQFLTLHVPPSANRWHRTVKGRPIISREARMYPKAVALSAMVQRIQCVPAPHEVDVEIIWYRAKKTGDVDKRGAILLDALQGVAYDDDKQVRRYTIERRDDDPHHPRVEVAIRVAQP